MTERQWITVLVGSGVVGWVQFFLEYHPGLLWQSTVYSLSFVAGGMVAALGIPALIAGMVYGVRRVVSWGHERSYTYFGIYYPTWVVIIILLGFSSQRRIGAMIASFSVS